MLGSRSERPKILDQIELCIKLCRCGDEWFCEFTTYPPRVCDSGPVITSWTGLYDNPRDAIEEAVERWKTAETEAVERWKKKT